MTDTRKAPTPDPRGRCGSYSGYRAHLRRKERPCADCRAANTARERARRNGEPTPKSPPAKARRKNVPLEHALGHTPAPAAVPEPAAEPDADFEAAASEPSPTPAKPVELPPEPDTETAKEPAKATAKRPVPDDVPTPPDWLKARGLDLWIEVTRAHDLNASALTLLAEACRTADRLERIAAALASRSTLWYELGDLDQATELGVPIVVNGMIGEARQLQTTLRQTLTTLGVVNVDAAKQVSTSPLDQLAARRKARLEAQGGA